MDAIPNEVYGVGCTVAAVVGFFLMARGGAKLQADVARREKEAEPAEAEVLAVSSSPLQKANRSQVSVLVTLRVQPPGGAPFEGVGAWELETVKSSAVEPGRRVPVKVGRDKDRTIFPAMEGMAYDPGNHRMWLMDQEDKNKK